MNKLLDYLARIIVICVALAVVGLLGFAFYLHTEIILPIVCGLIGIGAFVWALERLGVYE